MHIRALCPGITLLLLTSSLRHHACSFIKTFDERRPEPERDSNFVQVMTLKVIGLLYAPRMPTIRGAWLVSNCAAFLLWHAIHRR